MATEPTAAPCEYPNTVKGRSALYASGSAASAFCTARTRFDAPVRVLWPCWINCGVVSTCNAALHGSVPTM
nr:hypothetical protein CPGR_05761 [Mycolicibacter nonchromogenicus]